jgi:hypothetical protein
MGRHIEIPNNPVDLSKIRTQLVLLKTDTEQVAPELEAFHRGNVESLIHRMMTCDLGGVLTEYTELKASGELLAHRAIKSDIDVTKRVDAIDLLLKEILLEIATEKCQCNIIKEEV